MKIFVKAVIIYIIGIYTDSYARIFENRIDTLLANGQSLSDGKTIRMSLKYHRLRKKFLSEERGLKLLMSEAELAKIVK